MKISIQSGRRDRKERAKKSLEKKSDDFSLEREKIDTSPLDLKKDKKKYTPTAGWSRGDEDSSVKPL